MLEFDLQLFGGGKGGSSTTTNVTKYPDPTAQELAMQELQLKYAELLAPNALKLNEMGSEMLFNNPGIVPVDYTKYAEQGVAGAEALQKQAGDLANGVLPQSYLDNMNQVMKTGVDQSVGSALNSLAGRGVLNSSVTTGAMSDIGKNAQNVMAQNYQNAISQQQGLIEQQRGLLTSPMEIANAAQNASIDIPMKLYSASLGQQAPVTDTWRTMSNQRYAAPTTTSTQSYDNGSGLFGGILSGLASNSGLFCFVDKTQIRTPDGDENIADIKVGDEVICPDETDGSETVETVTAVLEPRYADVYAVVTTKGMIVECTKSQPFLTAKGEFKTLERLWIGDELKGAGAINSIVYSGERKVYDLKLTGKNNYFADGFIVKGGADEW